MSVLQRVTNNRWYANKMTALTRDLFSRASHCGANLVTITSFYANLVFNTRTTYFRSRQI
eukprot:scaffold16220_cov51-Attheya_sp.AAC.8